MSSLTISENYDPVTHRNEFGLPFKYAIIGTEDQIFLADTVSECVAGLIDGYADLPDTPQGDDQATILRHNYMIQVASILQARVLAHEVFRKGYQLDDDPDHDAVAVLLTDRNVFVSIEEWNHQVPLVMLRTDYEPYTAEQLPTGNLIWLDPSDEMKFLATLNDAAVIEFKINDTTPSDAELERARELGWED